jgi:pimeloyl-ACP methyl ester carboxylesterase
MEQFIERTPLGSKIAAYRIGSADPQILVLGGYAGRSISESPMTSMLEAAAKFGCRGTMIDISGTGKSLFHGSNSMERWIGDVEHVYRKLGGGSSIWIGSSIGAWVMLLLNRLHPEWFRSMCALAPAIDWDTQFLIPGVQSGTLRIEGDYVMVGNAPLPTSLVNSMARHHILDAPFHISAPLHIIQGALDVEARPQVAEKLSRHLSGAACTLERLPLDDHSVAKLGSQASFFAFERWLHHQLATKADP